MTENKSIDENAMKEKQPSATEDCADVTSKHGKYIKDLNKPKFPPIEYERPPHF